MAIMEFTVGYPGMCFYSNTSSYNFEWMMVQEQMYRNFAALLNRLAPQNLEPNPLIFLSRAVNQLRLSGRNIFQPRWSNRRWKSKT